MKTYATALALLVSGAASAETVATVERTRDICGEAAALFASGDIDQAYGSLLPYWPLAKEEVENLAYKTRQQLEMVGSRFGQPLAGEFVQTVSAGDSLVRHVFLIKHEKHALKFSCVFYKPKDTWLVNAVQWDDKPQSLVGGG